MDLMGPMRTESLGGKKCILVIVDDYSKFVWVAFLREKSNAFINFKDIRLKIQNEKGYPIGKISSNREKEFDNYDFLEFCYTLGIKHDFSTLRTQQNKVAKRKNRMIQEMTWIMLNQQDISTHIWAEAINTACYTSNRIHLHPYSRKTCYDFGKERSLV